MTEARQAIYAEIEQEREYQNERWGTDTDDTKNTPWMWAAYIAQYATRWMRGKFMPLDREDTMSFRACMVKVAGLAVAAVESIDRQLAAGEQGGSGEPFFERPFSAYTSAAEYEEQRDAR